MAGGVERVLCRIDELADPGTRGFEVSSGPEECRVFVVRADGRLHAYFNRCPHTGSPLDWVPDRFLSRDERYLQCATHDAMFRIDDGVCVAGPCKGDRLTPLTVRLHEGWILVTVPVAS